MQGRVRRNAWMAACVAALSIVASAARSPSLRASCSAAYRAFRDPSLLDAKPPPPPPPAALACRRPEDTARPEAAALAREFQAPDAADLDDAALSSLTLPDLRVPVTRRTLSFVRFFARSDAGRAVFLQRFRRAGAYRDLIENALREAGLPEDLLWVAAIESGFDPRAASPKGAAGLFQFMPETGKRYGLDQSPWVDERRSVVRASAAAAAHLRDLYERLRRWDLALAAYNAGYERVVSAMASAARARGAGEGDAEPPASFADLAAVGALPAETADYVPQIMAFALVASNRARFGLDQGEVAEPLEPAEIAVPAGTLLSTVARAAGISTHALRAYNPQLLRERVPPSGGDYLIAIPADRMARSLAALPAYLEQEVVAPEDGERDAPAALFAGAALPVPLDEESLPRRPVALGPNRLPELAPPPALPLAPLLLPRPAALLGFGALGDRLSLASVGVSVGWQRPYAGDVLDVLGGRPRDARTETHDAAIDAQLGFLRAPRAPVEALRSFTLPSGVEVRLRRDAGLGTATVTARLAAAPTASRGGEGFAVEALHTLTVSKGDEAAAIELAAARLRFALGEEGRAELLSIRRRAGEARRAELLATPYGPAWVALGDALFPVGHPLEGTVIGAERGPSAARDLLVAATMEGERARARASLTVTGDIDELRDQRLAATLLGALPAPAEAPVLPHPREERVTIDDAVPAPRALYGWIGPREEEAGSAALRVAIEILDNPSTGRLGRALLDSGLCSLARASLDVGPRATVAAIELSPAPDRALEAVEQGLDELLASLAREGLSADEVARARATVAARLVQEQAAPRPAAPGIARPATVAELRRALLGGRADGRPSALAAVTAPDVARAIGQVLARAHRVVVVTVPGARAKIALDTRPPLAPRALPPAQSR